MSIDTVLRSIQSLLDNTPYVNEPGQKDDKVYNEYVKCETWNTLLLSYLQHEDKQKLKDFMCAYVNENFELMKTEIQYLKANAPKSISFNHYSKAMIKDSGEEYDRILAKLQEFHRSNLNASASLQNMAEKTKCCQLCHQVLTDTNETEVDCGHSFHNDCLAIKRPNRCPECNARIEDGYLDLISMLPRPKICEICFEPLLEQKFHALFCKHLFHISCLKRNTVAMKECPKCLRKLDEFDRTEMNLIMMTHNNQ